MKRALVVALGALVVPVACSSTGPPATVVTQAPLPPTSGPSPPATAAARPSVTAPQVSTAPTAAPGSTVAVRPTPTVAPTPGPSASPTPPTPTTSAPPPASAGIAGFDFGTFTHDLGDGVTAPLVKGESQRGSSPADLDYLFARLRRTSVGDLDGDGADEAAVEVHYTTGGTGQFADVLVYEWDGTAPVLATRAGSGDRALNGIHRSYVDGGTLVIERLQGQAACCPEAVELRAFTLAGATLRPAGAARTWAFVVIDDADTPIRFLPGTSGAYLSGDLVGDRRGSFGARAGQTLTLDVLPGRAGEAAVVADVVQGDTVLGTAGPGAPLTVRLPTSGGYAIVPRAPAGGARAPYFDAVLSIG